MGATDSAPSLKAAVLTGSVRTIDAKRCFAKNDASEQRAASSERASAKEITTTRAELLFSLRDWRAHARTGKRTHKVRS